MTAEELSLDDARSCFSVYCGCVMYRVYATKLLLLRYKSYVRNWPLLASLISVDRRVPPAYLCDAGGCLRCIHLLNSPMR